MLPVIFRFFCSYYFNLHEHVVFEHVPHEKKHDAYRSELDNGSRQAEFARASMSPGIYRSLYSQNKRRNRNLP